LGCARDLKHRHGPDMYVRGVYRERRRARMRAPSAPSPRASLILTGAQTGEALDLCDARV